MPRYELSEGTSNKFWEITVKDNDVITHYGRIGSAGQSTTKSFKGSAEAKAAADKLIAEKTKKGYALTGSAATATAVPATAAAKEPAKSPASARTANPLIERLDRWLKKDRPEFYAALKPGASLSQIESFEAEIGHKLPATLKDLLLWKNCDDKKVPERFIDNWALMSLKSIAGCWRTMKRLKAAGDFETDEWWDTGWVMFMENGGGDNLCIDLKGSVGAKNSVIEFWHEDSDRNECYSSIDQMLKSFLDEVEQGHWAVDSGGLLQWGDESSEAANATSPEKAEAFAKAMEQARAKKSDPKSTVRVVANLPESKYAWAFYADASPDGKHFVYRVEEKSGQYFVFDGKKSQKFGALFGPWFDDNGTLVYREGKPKAWRWHIGEETHDTYEQSQNPVFSPDGKHHCYPAMKGKKWFLVVDGKQRSDSYDAMGADPVWSPDGKKIAFVAEANGKRFVVNDGVAGPVCLDRSAWPTVQTDRNWLTR